MQRLIRLRRELRPLAEGTLEFLHPENHKVLAFLRRCPSADGQGEEQLLVVANLSHSAQFVELDLSAYREKTPVEVLGRIRFPPHRRVAIPFDVDPLTRSTGLSSSRTRLPP